MQNEYVPFSVWGGLQTPAWLTSTIVSPSLQNSKSAPGTTTFVIK